MGRCFLTCEPLRSAAASGERVLFTGSWKLRERRDMAPLKACACAVRGARARRSRVEAMVVVVVVVEVEWDARDKQSTRPSRSCACHCHRVTPNQG